MKKSILDVVASTMAGMARDEQEKNMSSFTCETCGKSIVDDGGYITECEHYPAEGDEMKDELVERLSRQLKDARQTTDDLRVEFGKVVAERDRLREALKISPDSMQDLLLWLKDRREDIKTGMEDFGELQNLYYDIYPEQALKERLE